MAKPTKAPIRNRRSPGRDPVLTRGKSAPTPVDPVAILESIAANRRLKPTPRVAACRELIRLRLAMGKPAQEQTADAKRAEKTDRLDQQINDMALKMLRPRGQA